MQRIVDNDVDFVAPQAMLAELLDDNLCLTSEIRRVRNVCDKHNDDGKPARSLDRRNRAAQLVSSRDEMRITDLKCLTGRRRMGK